MPALQLRGFARTRLAPLREGNAAVETFWRGNDISEQQFAQEYFGYSLL